MNVRNMKIFLFTKLFKSNFDFFPMFLFLLTSVLSGCRTTDIDTELLVPSDKNSPETIKKLISQGKILSAIAFISNYQTEDNELIYFYQSSLEKINEDLIKSISKKNWKKTLIYFRSLKLLDELPADLEISETDILLFEAKKYLDSNQSGAAAALFVSRIDIESLATETRREFASVFREKGHLTLAAKLDKEEKQVPSISRLIDGTVTVWVDRGMRMIGNVGVPDRNIGSGFFIDPEGYIITNYHVISSEVDTEYEGFSRLYIKLDSQSKERIPAKVIGWEKNLDLALLKTEIAAPYVFDYSSGRLLFPGDNVKAIGSPGGLVRTLTSGTISSLERSIQTISDSMQVDVPINPGNSGGPLLDDRGEVIGVVFAGVEIFEGINFAIPVSYLTQLTPLMYSGGQTELAWLGIGGWEFENHIEVVYVFPGSPAAKADIRVGDKIVSLNGVEYNNIRGMQRQILGMYPGTLVKVKLERNDNIFQVLTVLGVRPEIPLKKAISVDRRDNLLLPIFGMSSEKISSGIFYPRYRVTSILPGSIADEAGFDVGDNYSLVRWFDNLEDDFVALQIIVRGRKAGFLESPLQIVNHLNSREVF